MASDDDVPDVTATAPAGGPSPEPAAASESLSRMDLAELLPSCSPAQFELGEEVGRGGIGRVLRARDPVFDRPIAIKELHSTSSNARVRFLREAMITARLQHPAIVPVYLAGRWPDGSPFYGMKLVDGKPLSVALGERKTLRERMGLLPAVIATCEAVAYAHRHRIVHRDLKPSNVLLGELGETVVIDWGLAKDLDEADAPEGAYGAVATASETIAGAVLGTPAYMPPEQGAGKEVDERGDVYSLGAILYELLAGVMPYSPSTTAREILAALARRPPEPLLDLTPEAPRDLVAIVERAMAREPAERYPDAAALADDLRRFQTGQLVSVREYGWLERVGRWMGKHRAAVGVAAAAVGVLLVVGALGFVSTLRAQRRAEAATKAEARERMYAEKQRDDAVLANAQAIVREDPAAAIAWLGKLSGNSEQWAAARTIAADAFAARIPTLFPDPGFRVDWMQLSDDDRLLVVGSRTARQTVVYDVATREPKRFEVPIGQSIDNMSPDGRWLVGVGDVASTIRISDGATTTFDTGGAKVKSGVVSPNSKWFAVVAEPKVLVFPVAGGAGRSIETPAAGILIELDDAGTLYGLDRERTAVWIYPATGEMRKVPISLDAKDDPRIGPRAWFKTWRWVVVLTRAGKLGVLETTTGAFELLPGDEVFTEYTVDRDATSIVGSTGSRAVRWKREAEGWKRVEEFAGAGARLLVGDTIVGGKADGLWLRRDGAPVVGRVPAVPHPNALSRDARALFAATTNGMVARWDLSGGDSAICSSEPTLAVDARYLVQRGASGTLGVCDPRDGTQRTLVGGTRGITDVRPSSSFGFMVSRGEGGEIVVWDVAAGRGDVLATTGFPVTITDDGAKVIVNDSERLFVVDVATGAREARCETLADDHSATSIDGTAMVRVSSDQLEICDLATGAVRTLEGYPGELFFDTLRFDGALVYVNGVAGPMMWDVRTNRRYPLDVGMRDFVTVAELVPDDKGVVVAGARFAAVFDARGRLVRRVARTGRIGASGVTVSSDRRRIVTTDFLEHARLYDVDTQRSRVLGGGGSALGARFFDNDRLIVTFDSDRRPYRFSDGLPDSATELRELMVRTAASITLDVDGRSVPAR